ncbi:MAG: citramalate synthase [bacterium]|nr:citramalate synthase [bacterium]
MSTSSGAGRGVAGDGADTAAAGAAPALPTGAGAAARTGAAAGAGTAEAGAAARTGAARARAVWLSGDLEARARAAAAAHRTPAAVEIYDTTLRDGSQLEGISLTVEDKLRIARELDRLGVHYIEGGWPGANPKDDEFFARAAEELRLETARLAAFGSTRRVGGRCDRDAVLANLLAAGTRTVCIVGKCWDYHVSEALRTSLDEGIAMAAESVAYLVGAGRRVFFDAEGAFDGYKHNPDYSLAVLAAVAEAGAERLVLCDTNGGSLPHEVYAIVAEIVDALGAPVGVHLHNDTGCGVANALAGVRAGATQVQGTINGYGERTGNCDLVPIIANLSLKMGVATLPPERLELLTSVSRRVAEMVNWVPDPQQPYVGTSAFAHKAGLHASALARRADAYEHIDPVAVGNGTRFVVSEMAGRSSIELKAEELGIEMDAATVAELIETLKRLEYEGYQFEVADASLELWMRAAAGWEQPWFRIESFRVEVGRHMRPAGEPPPEDAAAFAQCEATIKLWVGDQRRMTVGEGNGPVHALHNALLSAVGDHYPEIARITLTDYKVRVLDTAAGTAAVTRVLIDSSDGARTWTTIGVSENIVEASWEALSDSIVWGLLHSGTRAPAA